MRASLPGLVAAIVIAGAASARADAPVVYPGYAPPRVTKLKLASAAELWVVPDATLPLLTVRVIMPGAGAAADPAGKGGLADYAADLLFEAGAGELGARQLAERLEGMGSHLASWAEVDAAFVETTMLARTRKDTLALLGDVLASPRFELAEGRRVHDDRKTAVVLRRDEPGAVAHLILRAALQGAASPYGHPVQGTLASLAAFGVDDARAFYKAHYGTQRMIIVAAGDVDPEALRADLDAALGAWRGKPSAPVWPRPRDKAPGGGDRLFVVDRAEAEQANVLVGAIGVARSDVRASALEVATSLLGGTFSSRLSHRLREELGLTYGVSAIAGYERALGVVAIESAMSTPRTGEGLGETLRLVADLARTPVPPDELAAVKANLVRSLPQAFNSNDAIVDAFADLAAAGLPSEWFDGYAAQIEAVGAADVQKAARTLLAPERLVVVIVGPLGMIGADVAKLGLGRPALLDADGTRVK